jgi:tRNA-intron endonuclease
MIGMAKKRKSKKNQNRKIEKQLDRSKIKAIFKHESVESNTKEAISLYEKSRFGEKKQEKIVYSIFEALYLLERGKIEIKSARSILDFDKLMKKARKSDKNLLIKYLVFKDMRSRGYIVKTALKFGADFRVYEKGVKPGQDHARWILYPVSERKEFTWHEFSAKNRVAHSTKKNLLIGIVDEEQDITYYEVRWIRP